MQPSVTHNQRGFTLVEMAFVVLIMGIIVGGFFNFMRPHMEQKNQQITVQRQEKIARALSDFAQRTMILPCPGNPNVVGTLAIGEPRAICNGTLATDNPTRVGIVPFRFLGLTQEDVTDGFGNPFTYAVALRAVTAYAGTTLVHNQCRTTTGTVPWITIVTNNYPNKAVFCCRQQDTVLIRLQVFDSIAMTQTVTTTQNTTVGFAGQGTPAASTPDIVAYFAYVLVSHGKNGERSYIWGNAARKTLVNAGLAEQENADEAAAGNDLSFVSIPRSTAAGTNYFDDIVLWRTQQGLIAELGNDSCARP